MGRVDAKTAPRLVLAMRDAVFISSVRFDRNPLQAHFVEIALANKLEV